MKVCTGITCILSMLGCVVIISSYARWRDLRSKSRLLLACLSVGDYMNAVGNGVSALSPPTSSDDIGCKVLVNELLDMRNVFLLISVCWLYRVGFF